MESFIRPCENFEMFELTNWRIRQQFEISPQQRVTGQPPVNFKGCSTKSCVIHQNLRILEWNQTCLNIFYFRDVSFFTNFFSFSWLALYMEWNITEYSDALKLHGLLYLRFKNRWSSSWFIIYCFYCIIHRYNFLETYEKFQTFMTWWLFLYAVKLKWFLVFCALQDI